MARGDRQRVRQKGGREGRRVEGDAPSGHESPSPGGGGAGAGGHRRRVAVASVVAAAALVVGLLVRGWLRGDFLPGWIRWQTEELACDLDGDGDFEAVRLDGRRVTVTDDGEPAASSKDAWLVSHALVGDVNRDGIQELVLIAWKRGSYGTSRPFWVTHDDPGFSEHVFIFRYQDGRLVPVWMSSDIGMDAQDAWLDAHDDLHLRDTSGSETTWEWQGFGLILIDDASPSLWEGESTLTLAAVGDNIAHDGMLSEAATTAAAQGEQGYDFAPVYGGISDWAGAADVAAVVQETPLVSDPTLVGGYPVFGTPSEMGDALRGVGFDVVCAATNHAYDQGEKGLEDTVAYWSAHPEETLVGIRAQDEAPFSPRYVERNGIRLAVFDATYGLNQGAQPEGDAYQVELAGDCSGLAAGLRAAEGEADASVCFLHCGEEYSQVPTEEVEQEVGELIDAGADVVICSHPHVVQRAESLTTDSGATGVVFYSLGNLASNQPYPQTVLGAAARVTFRKVTTADGGTETTVCDCQAVPLVCHQQRGDGASADGSASASDGDDASGTDGGSGGSGGETRVYLLRDYTEEMAEKHGVNDIDEGSVSLEGLRGQWDETMTGE